MFHWSGTSKSLKYEQIEELNKLELIVKINIKIRRYIINNVKIFLSLLYQIIVIVLINEIKFRNIKFKYKARLEIKINIHINLKLYL